MSHQSFGAGEKMLVIEFVFALVTSMLCAALLLPATVNSGYRLQHPGLEPLGAFGLLLVLFLGTWAGGLWLVPVGPKLWGVAWVTLLAVGFVVALLLRASTGARADRETSRADVEERSPIMSLLALVPLLLLTLAVVAGYAGHR